MSAKVLLAVVPAVVLAGCGGSDEAHTGPTQATVCDAVSGEASGQVLLEGSATRLVDLGRGLAPSHLGFVLSQEDCSILVVGPGRKSHEVEAGEPLTVDGLRAELSSQESARVRDVLDRSSEIDEITDGVPGTLRFGPGAPYIDAFSLTGET